VTSGGNIFMISR